MAEPDLGIGKGVVFSPFQKWRAMRLVQLLLGQCAWLEQFWMLACTRKCSPVGILCTSLWCSLPCGGMILLAGCWNKKLKLCCFWVVNSLNGLPRVLAKDGKKQELYGRGTGPALFQNQWTVELSPGDFFECIPVLFAFLEAWSENQFINVVWKCFNNPSLNL